MVILIIISNNYLVAKNWSLNNFFLVVIFVPNYMLILD